MAEGEGQVPALADPTPTSQDTAQPPGLVLDWSAGTIGGQRFQTPPGWSLQNNDRFAAGKAMIDAGSTWFDTPDVAARYGVPLGSVFDAQGNFRGVFPTAGMEGLPASGHNAAYRLDPRTLQWQKLQLSNSPFGLPDWGFGALMAALVLGGGVAGGLAAGGAGAGAAVGTAAGAEAGALAPEAAAAVADAAALGGVEAGGVGLEAGAGFGLGSGGILGTGITTTEVGNVLRALSTARSLYNIGTNPSGQNVGSLIGSVAGGATGLPFGSTVGGMVGGQAGGAIDPQTGEPIPQAQGGQLGQTPQTPEQLASVVQATLPPDQAQRLLQDPQTLELLLLLLELEQR